MVVEFETEHFLRNLKIISLDDYDAISQEFDLRNYPKLASIINLRKAGLPTLPGYVTGNISDDTLEFLDIWRVSLNADRLSLRFDSPNPQDLKKLSISNPTIDELKQIKDFVRPPIIGIVLAPNDRFNQDHSVLTQFLSDSLRCEIVGPGFDASDITRGNVTPHEIFEIERRTLQENVLTPLDIHRHEIISEDVYQKSLKRRYGVILSILDKGLGKDVVPEEIIPEQIQTANRFLKTRDASLPVSYVPIGFERLQKLYTYLLQFDLFHSFFKEQLGIDTENKVISSSFLKRYGLVFWDIYDGNKYFTKNFKTT